MNKVQDLISKAASLELVDCCDSASSGAECDYDDIDQDETDFVQRQVKGLFTDKVFDNVKDLFTYEAQTNQFNLVEVLARYDMDMIAYIKMINFIRLEKPLASVFCTEYADNTEMPWDCDKYMKTSVEDDAALQFDIEEDLDTLELKFDENNNVNKKVENDLVRQYKNKFHESNSKVEELTEIVGKLRNLASGLLNKTSSAKRMESCSESESSSDAESDKEDDSVYVNSYSNYNIHLEMLQDKVRTEGYMNAILDNKDVFKDKVVLDVGCGSGILSLFAAKAGAKMVIAVDMSNIIEHAIQTAKINGFEKKIVFLKGKMEEVKLPVDKVDIIISEWMGYFLVFESMLDSVLYARNKYLSPNGIVLPNFFEMHLFAVNDEEHFSKTITFWQDVYGFKMPTLQRSVIKDAQIITIPAESVVSDSFLFKEIDCLRCTVESVSKFEKEFELTINKDTQLTGIGSSFETFFNDCQLKSKSEFSTNSFNTTTHWQQTLFQFDESVSVKKDSVVKGKITCYKNPDYLRSYIVILDVFNKVYKYKVE